MALHLGEKSVLKQAVDAVPIESTDLVVQSLDASMIRDFLHFIADNLVITSSCINPAIVDILT